MPIAITMRISSHSHHADCLLNCEPLMGHVESGPLLSFEHNPCPPSLLLNPHSIGTGINLNATNLFDSFQKTNVLQSYC